MLLIAFLIIPILGALGCLSFKNYSRQISIVTGSILVLLFGYLVNSFYQKGPIEVSYNWIENLSINLHFKVDGFRLTLVGLTSFLGLMIILSSQTLNNIKQSSLQALILICISSLFGVYMAQNLFVFYFFYEIALVPVYFIALNWGSPGISKASFKMFAYTVLGSLMMLSAFLFLYYKTGTSTFSALSEMPKSVSKINQYFIFWALFFAFGIKMPVFPFHAWQPNAYSLSPYPGTQLLSGLLSKMGVFGLIVILLPLCPLGLNQYSNLAMILSLIGLLYGSFIAISLNDIKRLLAYSSFAHMGLMAAGVFTQNLYGLQGASYQMIAHGINIVGLFYAVQIIESRTGTLDLKKLGGISQNAPIFTVLFIIIVLGSVALPLTNGFIGEFLLLKGIFDFKVIFGILAGLTIILGAVYMLRFVQFCFFNQTTELTKEFKDINGIELFVLVPIALLVLFLGIYPNDILNITEPFLKTLIR